MSNYKIIACVSHMDEKTLDYCIETLNKQTIPLQEIKVFSGITPMCNSFNTCLDYAYEKNVDLLLHLDADVFANDIMLETLLKCFNIEKNFMAVGSGYDLFNLCPKKHKYINGSVGIKMFNMRIIKNIYRFKDEFMQDLKFVQRLEKGTGLTLARNQKVCVGYHHPIWTIKEIFLKFIYSSYKYKDNVVQKHLRAFKYYLTKYPTNKVLLLGKIILNDRLGPKKFYIPLKSKNNNELDKYYEEWKNKYRDLIDIQNDNEYFVHEAKFKNLAEKIFGIQITKV